MTAPSPLTDTSLLRRLARDDGAAAGELFRRYARRISSLARSRLGPALLGRTDADDVVQSVFRLVFEKARGGALSVPDGYTLWHLLAAVTVNTVRRQTAYHTADRRDARSTVPWDEGGGSAAADDPDLLAVAVADVLAALPAEFARLIDLRLQGYRVEEIAAATGRSLRSTERVLQACRQHLESHLLPGDE